MIFLGDILFYTSFFTPCVKKDILTFFARALFYTKSFFTHDKSVKKDVLFYTKTLFTQILQFVVESCLRLEFFHSHSEMREPILEAVKNRAGSINKPKLCSITRSLTTKSSELVFWVTVLGFIYAMRIDPRFTRDEADNCRLLLRCRNRHNKVGCFYRVYF